MTTGTTTGTDTLRAALRARKNLTLIARDVGVALNTLQDFSTGSVALLPEVKQKIATYIFGDRTVFDADADLLRSVSPPARPIATALPPVAVGQPIPRGYPNTGKPAFKPNTNKQGAGGKRKLPGWAS